MIPINYDHSSRKNNLFRIIADKGPYRKRAAPKEDDTITHGICENDSERLLMEKVNKILKTRADTLYLTASNPAWLTHFYINERKAFLIGGKWRTINTLLCVISSHDFFRCSSLSFTCWGSRHEFGFTRW